MGLLGVSTPSQDEAGSKAARFIDTGGKASGEGSMLEYMEEGGARRR
jgi:hypothetical protein